MEIFNEEDSMFLLKYYSKILIDKPLTKDMSMKITNLKVECIGKNKNKIICVSNYDFNEYYRDLSKVINDLNLITISDALKDK